MPVEVKEILSIEPFIIKALWSDGKTRTIDFGIFLADYFEKEQTVYFKILNKDHFQKAKTDGRTIYWENMSEMVDYDGKLIPAPLDFCPDVLFEQSVVVA